MIVMQMRAHHEVDFLRSHAGGGEPLEIRQIEHVPKWPPRLDLVVAAARVDQDFLATDLQQPAVNGEPDATGFGLVMMRCKPRPVFGQMRVTEFRKDFAKRISRKICLLDANNGGVTYAEQHLALAISPACAAAW